MLGRAQRLDFKRGMAISAALHVFLLLMIGLAFGEKSPLPRQPEESYVIVDLEGEPHVLEIAAGNVPASVSQHISAPRLSRPSVDTASERHTSRNSAAAASGPAHGGLEGSFASAEAAAVGNHSATWDGKGEVESPDAEPSREDAPPAEAAVDVAALAATFAGRVEAYKEYPYMALKRGLMGKVEVLVNLSADGSLAGTSVITSSGISSLDESAVKAVKKACPFLHGAQKTLQFVIPIYYELRG